MRINLYWLYTSICVIISCNLYSQEKNIIKPKNGDCNNAIEITDTIWEALNSPVGHGEIMEITGHKNSNYFFEQEHNTVWYFFIPQDDCTLTFDIVPVNINDDYDFILYKETGYNFCDRIKLKKPVRTNISRNNRSINSKTGLSKDAENEYFHSGMGPSYCKEIEVEKGVKYYLVLDNVYDNGSGHSIYIHYNCSTEVNQQKFNLNINVLDKETREIINSYIDIFLIDSTGLQIPYMRYEDIGSCFIPFEQDKNYLIRVKADEYLGYSLELNYQIYSDPVTLNVELEKIVIGQNIILENVYFYGNQSVFLPESYESLDNLYMSLYDNPTVTIEIQGHVNAPRSEPGSYYQLSFDRAKAVYQYLVDKGIDAGRLTFKGFANNNMVFPDATTEEEMKKNRRVEIVILSK